MKGMSPRIQVSWGPASALSAILGPRMSPKGPVVVHNGDSGTWPHVTSLHIQKTERWKYLVSSVNDLCFPGDSAVKNLPAIQETQV